MLSHLDITNDKETYNHRLVHGRPLQRDHRITPYLKRLLESPLLVLSWYCNIRKQRVNLPPYLPKMVPRQATLRTVLYMIL